MSRLAPLSEEPVDVEEDHSKNRSKKGWPWGNWLKSQLISISSFTMFTKKSNLRVLLSVLGCPLFPVPPLLKSSINEVQSMIELSHRHVHLCCFTHMKQSKNSNFCIFMHFLKLPIRCHPRLSI